MSEKSTDETLKYLKQRRFMPKRSPYLGVMDSDEFAALKPFLDRKSLNHNRCIAALEDVFVLGKSTEAVASRFQMTRQNLLQNLRRAMIVYENEKLPPLRNRDKFAGPAKINLEDPSIQESLKSINKLKQRMDVGKVSAVGVANIIDSISNHPDPYKQIRKSQIARLLNISPPLMFKYSKLLQMPEAVKYFFDRDRCRDVQALYSLIKLYEKSPEEVKGWLDAHKFTNVYIRQETVREFEKSLKCNKMKPSRSMSNLDVDIPL